MSIKEIQQKTVNVQHKVLQVPTQEYLQKVKEYPEPYSQEALQCFASDYLKSIEDNGIIGMVRYDKEDKNIIIDAAVRYPEDMS
ncbi:hypothetical protein PRVXT_001958 [Proteinivorax tanatarense]|uniref:Uncharacterized protein n=1 Tax=Proteinivorax tanatarense TaxID=1260629 RepID=A0AAU7VIY9_9FIRM